MGSSLKFGLLAAGQADVYPRFGRTMEWDTAAGRDIIWRSRAKASAAILAKIVKDNTLPEAEKDHLMRAFDYQPTAEKDKALESLLQ